VNDECLAAFNQLKTKSKYKYIVFQLNGDESEIVIEKSVESETWENFVTGLPKSDCRYIVFDFDYEPSEGGIRKKIIFIFWSPDAAKIRTKMIYASSEESLKSKLNVQTRIQANDFSDLDFDSILSRICNVK
jgi:cofilin